MPVSQTPDAPFVIICGDTGEGKTVDVAAAAHDFLFIARPGAMQSARSVWGLPFSKTMDIRPPEVWKFNELSARDKGEQAEKMTASLHRVINSMEAVIGTPQAPAGLVLDEMGHFFDLMVSGYKANFRGNDKRQMWGDIKDVFTPIRARLRRLGIPLIMTMRLKHPPRDPAGRIIGNGGPMMSGASAEALVSDCDYFLRVERDSTNPLLKWPRRYATIGRDNYLGKARSDIIDPAPANLGEILRSSGVNVSYPEPSMGERVETLAQSFTGADLVDIKRLGGEAYTQAMSDYAKLPERTARGLAYWIIRDAYDRHRIREGMAQKYASPWK
jgi:hypothetical protein